MTPEEVFAQLRDIHAPQIGAIADTAFDFRPFLCVVAIAVMVFAARYGMAYLSAQRALAKLDRSATPAQQRDDLVRVLAATPRRRHRMPAPESLFSPPEAVTHEDVTQLRSWAARTLR